jgi:hypothetical protein
MCIVKTKAGVERRAQRRKDIRKNITIDKYTHRRIKKGTGMHLVTGRNTEKKTSRNAEKKAGRHRQSPNF